MGVAFCELPEIWDIWRTVNMKSIELLQSRVPYWNYPPPPPHDLMAELSTLAQHCPYPLL